jgi:hypothetical protein
LIAGGTDSGSSPQARGTRFQEALVFMEQKRAPKIYQLFRSLKSGDMIRIVNELDTAH